MRLEVLKADGEEFAKATAKPECGPGEIAEYVISKLAETEKAKSVVCSFQGYPTSGTKSTDFRLMGNMERAIVDFLRSHEYPKHVRILCEDDESVKMHKVVYNFWFAEDKSLRMKDESWD